MKHSSQPRLFLRALLAGSALGWTTLFAASEPSVSFSREILPILSDHCFPCHGPDEKSRKAKLRLDTKEGAHRVRDGVASIVPGSPDQSALYQRLVTSDADDVMPPSDVNRKLSAAQIAKIRLWIQQGASWGEHWAFEKPKRVTPSGIPESESEIHPVDRIVHARLIKEGLQPSPPAPPAALLRRVSLDLTGLPPDPEIAAAFLRDPSVQHYQSLVERWLASPAYGERMAWDWMEAARYADSNGYQGDGERSMWPWRDWVVRAFNQNLPYDQFTLWQIAGDLLPHPTRDQRMATGFNRNHPINGEGGRIPEENRVDYVMDMTETVGTVWLGLTFNCCRCHDHKFDPLSQRDYFSLSAFFNQTPVDGSGGDPQTKPFIELPNPKQSARLQDLQAKVSRLAQTVAEGERLVFPRAEGEAASDSGYATREPDAIRAILRAESAARTRSQISELEKHFESRAPLYIAGLKQLRESMELRDNFNRSIPRVMVMEDMPKPRKTFMLEAGLYDRRREEIPAALPARLSAGTPGQAVNRLDLARWIVSPDHPLTARVAVNRLWQQFFGIGLVKTSEDFGIQGEKPIYQDLLDFLALELIDSGWDWKHLCRLIVTSETYRQTSAQETSLRQKDPENRLLARGPRFRMPSWMIRDQALAAAGLLSTRVGGPPVKPYQPTGVWEEATFGNKRYTPDQGESLYRRSLYVFWRRIIGPTMFFDTAPRSVCSVKPLRTNSPLQALATMDDETYVEAARVLAERALLEPNRDDPQRLESIMRRLLARPPSPQELDILRASLERLRREYRADPDQATRLLAHGAAPRAQGIDPVEHAAYTALASTLLNLDETLSKE